MWPSNGEEAMDPFEWRNYLTWEGRINRRDYMIGSQVVGMVGFFVGLLLIVPAFLWPQIVRSGVFFALVFLLIAALCVPSSSLLVRRAHDHGWPAFVSLGIFFLPLALVSAFFLTIFVTGREPDFPRAIGTTPLFWVVMLMAVVVSYWLGFKKGQPVANRYGNPPD